MKVILYNQGSPTNLINKNLGDPVATLPVIPNPTGPVELINPVFVLDIGSLTSTDEGKIPSNFNYCYVPALKRYYFVSDITYSPAKTMTINCHCDVLYTYRDKIAATTLNFIGGADGINEVDDGSYPLGDYIQTLNYDVTGWSDSFSNTEAGRRYVLRVAASGVRPVDVVSMELGSQIIYQKWLYTLTLTTETHQPILQYSGESYDSSLPRIIVNKTVVKYNGGNYTLTPYYDGEHEYPTLFNMSLVT